MRFTKTTAKGGANGVAALAILKTLLQVMKRKNLLSDEEIDILLQSAEVEVDNTDLAGSTDEAKFLISTLLKDADGDTTTGYNSRRYT